MIGDQRRHFSSSNREFDHSDGQNHKYSEKAEFNPANKGNKPQWRESKGGGTQTGHKPQSAVRAVNHSQQHTEKYGDLCFIGRLYMVSLVLVFLLWFQRESVLGNLVTCVIQGVRSQNPVVLSLIVPRAFDMMCAPAQLCPAQGRAHKTRLIQKKFRSFICSLPAQMRILRK